MSELFPNQYWGMDIWKHQELPIIESHDFNFLDVLNLQIITMGKQLANYIKGT